VQHFLGAEASFAARVPNRCKLLQASTAKGVSLPAAAALAPFSYFLSLPAVLLAIGICKTCHRGQCDFEQAAMATR
jgi:hypothetical protein